MNRSHRQCRGEAGRPPAGPGRVWGAQSLPAPGGSRLPGPGYCVWAAVLCPDQDPGRRPDLRSSASAPPGCTGLRRRGAAAGVCVGEGPWAGGSRRLLRAGRGVARGSCRLRPGPGAG